MATLDDYDPKRMKDQDRRYLIGYLAECAMFNVTGKLNNTVIMVTLGSFLVALFSLVYSFVGRFSRGVIMLGVIELFLVALLLERYFRANRRLNKSIQDNTRRHNAIFELQYGYAKKEKQK